jgi:serine/threonine kinase 3
MEYCGAGSVSDIMRLRKKTLSEDEISTILSDTLKGLEYLHLRRKIHRGIIIFSKNDSATFYIYLI